MEIKDWNVKYEPIEFDDMILNSSVRVKLENIYRNPQNVTLYGTPGIGKGTFTNIFIKRNGCFPLNINGSKETGIDNIRDQVTSFANAGNPTAFFDMVGTDGKIIDGFHKDLKVIVLNEAENISKQAQAALRELIEQVESRCKFILMTNDLSKIDDAIKSRCPPVKITNPPMNDIIRHVGNILDTESIKYNGEAVSNIVSKYYPDIRRTVKEIQFQCNGHELFDDISFQPDITIDKIILDLKLYMAYWNIEKKEIYDMIKNKIEFHIGDRQFYYLFDKKNQTKISASKRDAVISFIQENINLKDWLNNYLQQ